MPSPSRSRGSESMSPAQHDFYTNQGLKATAVYPASASREIPMMMSAQGQSSYDISSRGRQNSLTRHSSATPPLSVRKLNVCTSPPPSTCPQPNGGRDTAKSGAARRPSAPVSTTRGLAGATYTVRAGQHPLFTGSSHSRLVKPQLFHPPQRRTPPPSSAPDTAAASMIMMISPENNTVRGLRGSAMNGLASTTEAGLTHAAKRNSVIERIAAAAGFEDTAHNDSNDNAGTARPPSTIGGDRLNAAPRGTATVHFQLPSNGGVTHPSVTESQALEPLVLHDAMKMRLQQPPSNVMGESSLAQQRLPAEALVLRPPEKTADGKDNAMYLQLSSFKMAPLGVVGDSNGKAEKTLTDAATAPLPSVPTAVPQANVPLSGSAAAATNTTTGITTTTSVPPPPPAASLPQPSNEATAASQLAGQPSAAVTPAVTPSPANPSPPVLHASFREPTSEEKAAAEADHLMNDLISSAAQRRHNPAEPVWNAHGTLPFAEDALSPAPDADASTEADMAAQYVRRQISHNRCFVGWQPPPTNVLLPDPAQPDATWSVLANATAQAVQQAAASQTIAQSRGAADANTIPGVLPPRSTYGAEATAAADGEATAAVRCADYHAPFQQVLHPECVEDFHALPDTSGIVVDTGGAPSRPDLSEAERAIQDALRQSSTDTTARSFASQAVILRDPLSLLACEHLADDTVGMVARRRSYLTAMMQLNGALQGDALPSSKGNTSALQSVLQTATPPGEVFCELTYQAKVLLSTILYMRALGALPTLLRVGPLTEYSPVIDKGNCIELVFYNPSDEEREQQAAQQAAQQDVRRRQSLQRQRTVVYHQAPLAQTHSAAMSPMKAGRLRSRSQPPAQQQQQQQQQRETSPGIRAASALRNRPRSLSATPSTWHRTARGNSADDVGELAPADRSAGHALRSPLLSRRRSSPSQMSPAELSQVSQQQQFQRQPSAVEGLLLQSLSNVAMRRSGSTVFQSEAAPFHAKAEQVFGVTSKAPLTGAGLTSLASPLLRRSREPSLLIDESMEVDTPASVVYRRPNFYNENGGAWLQRSLSQDAASRVHMQPWSRANAETGNNTLNRKACAMSNSARQRQRRGSECCGGMGPAAIPHARGGRGGDRHTTVTPTRHIPSSTTTPTFAAPADAALQTHAALRRSSVHLAVEQLKHDADAEKPAVSPSASSPATWRPTRTPVSPFQPSVSFKSLHDTGTVPHARAAKPVPPHGAGASRFPAGERELCVVLRAVVAQKSHVYAFGESETVHVLPPLPPRSIDDGVDADALLLQQMQRKKSELERLAMDASNPLVRFLSGSTLRNAGSVVAEAKEQEAERRQVSLREQARRVAAAARRQAPAAVDVAGRPVTDDYGDVVVAFVLSKNASELSGSVPDMMELETLRYRIFLLEGYSSSDPSGMQAVRAAGATAATGEEKTSATTASAAAAASLPESPGAGVYARALTRDSSPLDTAQSRLQSQLSSYKAFQRNNATRASVNDQRALSPETSVAIEARESPIRASARSVSKRMSYFESILRKTDPTYTPGCTNDEDGAYMSELDLQLLRQRQHQQQRAAVRARYPVYRASSVAESTLQAFHAEAVAAVSAARRRRRRGESEDGGGNERRGDA
ncbi:hypothetical protein ABB37_00915 [Leptomonas pyrrhocoris]|uniref:Uncharacterized protein n=1 Tax=Leptomonas pyrrhocoris TaxID=157538 RepID=A0A0M9GBK9_LEPPY|nr:hypothetical protein ABB37_00915 [Leptomonas pyrrhocoris]KPA86869.1 hypothetical protein ABB37_00915 [Leptomonas pyrrhocoris]|eukprot:XP_015665308.1 hypothetical protein ABB37_00915 [Leptomonas pyrrhocoris]